MYVQIFAQDKFRYFKNLQYGREKNQRKVHGSSSNAYMFIPKL